ncbi:DNA polymerase III subunit psi [Colwellia sp. E2M01]|uniref:DNA polymerase III subunit psi n=1 Tax=Colwellia sp. E2M01 TaxID=2841561 RepID=UPI001C08888B|nr:DNA polymerase III subunit psi [Colwellia sp. E2M01]MBU2869295.1 DNA polymerase III subunit psi [Colwellia sp. E2M01]
MSINQHQFEQLTEMGISLWQRRKNDLSTEKSSEAKKTYIDIDLDLLAQQQLFTDILLATGLTIGEIKPQADHLDLGLFNWFFIRGNESNASENDTSAKHSPEMQAHWHNQQLFTPSIIEISKSPILKKQLWQLLSSKTQ